jgi:hypothetical protein
MKQFSRLILLFSLVFAVFFVGPPLLHKDFAFFPLISTGEVLDLLTPVVLLPLYWLLYQRDSVKSVPLTGCIIFLILPTGCATATGGYSLWASTEVSTLR